MNILFHLTIGTSIIATLSNSNIKTKNELIQKTALGGFIGMLSHGVLDYTPHCYPIHSKIDVIIGFLFILFTLWVVKKQWKVISLFTLLDCIIPDVIDLSPGIINTLLNINLPTFNPIFPWHFHKYSGPIYTGDCTVSSINHILVLLFTGIIIWCNRNGLLNILNYGKA